MSHSSAGDIQFFGSLAGSFSPGDFDQDGDIDGDDFLTWQRGLDSTYSAADLANWEDYFGNASSAVASALSVPEPAASALGLCFAAIAALSPQHRLIGTDAPRIDSP